MNLLLALMRSGATRPFREPLHERDSERLRWPGSSMEERRSDKPQTAVQLCLGSPERITGTWSNRSTHRPFKPKIAGSNPVVPIRRDVVQLGSTPALGAGGRRFKSDHPDQSNGAIVQRPECQTVDLETGVRFPVVPPTATLALCRTRAQERNCGRHALWVASSGKGETTLPEPQRGVAKRIRHLSSKQAFAGSSPATPVR